jgi:signal transduction histidine kinase
VLQAVVASQREGETASREARILVRGEKVDALDLLVTARQATADGRRLCICILRDISDQKRRAILEDLFFHDILNTAGGISALAGLLTDPERVLPPDREKDCRSGMARLSQRLIQEISHQRDLLEAERGLFVPRVEDVAVPDVARDVRELYRGHPVAKGRRIEIREQAACTISSDGVIIRRVLGNLVKNALEATAEGGVVSIACRDLGERIAFEVHNPGVMSREVQLQVFQRSFSTKAARGRGIGTYSIKLFVERYLKGAVGFTSAEPEGTTFRVTVPKEPAAARD